MAQSKIRHSVIITHYRGVKDTNECLASIAQAELSNVSVYLVLTGDKRGLKLDYPWLETIEISQNLGFAGSNNLGLKRAMRDGAELLTLLNNDTTVGQHLFRRIQQTFTTHPNLGAMSGKIYFSINHEFHRSRYKNSERGKVIWYAGGLIDWFNVEASHRGVDQIDTGQFDKAYDTDFATGCLFTTTRHALDKVGLLDEKFFLYLEDVDLSVRLKNAGLRLIYDPTQTIWHKNASSSGGSGSALHDYYLTRNRLIFGFRYASSRTKLALARQSVKLLASGRPWQKQAVKDYYTRHLGPKITLHPDI